jgi:hypothetical protein
MKAPISGISNQIKMKIAAKEICLKSPFLKILSCYFFIDKFKMGLRQSF